MHSKRGFAMDATRRDVGEGENHALLQPVDIRPQSQRDSNFGFPVSPEWLIAFHFSSPALGRSRSRYLLSLLRLSLLLLPCL